MVGRRASLDGRLFFGGTDGSNPVPSSRESCKLHFMSPGLAHRSEADFSRGLGRGTSATGTDQLFPRTGLAHLRCREH
jgi:hypothetical protein